MHSEGAALYSYPHLSLSQVLDSYESSNQVSNELLIYPWHYQNDKATQPAQDLRNLGPYNLCLPDGRMKSRSYTLNEDGTWSTNIHYFETNSIENTCNEEDEW